MTEKVRNRRLADDRFFRIRKEEVLTQWEIGKQIDDLDECIAVARELSRGKSHALKLREAKEKGTHLLIPQVGQALTEYTIEGLQYVEAESDLAPNGMWNLYPDSYARKLEGRWVLSPWMTQSLRSPTEAA